MAGTKQAKVSGDPQRKQVIHETTLSTNSRSAAICSLSVKGDCLCGCGCEVITVCRVVPLGKVGGKIAVLPG